MASSVAQPEPIYHVEVLDRVFRILDFLAETTSEPSASDLASGLQLHKSTVHRLLAILERQGFIERNGETGRYRLGWRLFELGTLSVARLDICTLARPHVEKLMRRTGETAHLGVMRGDELISLVNAETDRSVRTPLTVGRRSPLYCTSQGKIFLAALPEPVQRQMLTRLRMRAFTPNTITQISRMRAELALVQRRGYAMDNQEFEEGLRCIGAPVRNHLGTIVAGISIAGPAYRVGGTRLPELIEAVLAAGRDLSSALGFRQRTSAPQRRETATKRPPKRFAVTRMPVIT